MSSLCKAFKNPLIELKSLICNNKNTIRCSSIDSRAIEEKKIRVKDVDINYAKTGVGEHPVLLLPGAMGSIWSDFEKQMETLDRKKLTIVAWDPSGYGGSRPPNRTYPNDFFYRDADYAHQLMKNLGFSRFSLLGFSNGGVSALIIAGNNPESIEKLVVTGSRSYISAREFEYYKKKGIQNIDNWPESMRARRLTIYDEDYFRKTWWACADAYIDIYENNNGDICKELIKKIKCPTLIVHGRNDTMVNSEQSEFLFKHISNSRLKLFEKGGHYVHEYYHEEFNRLATEFLLENS